MANLIHIGNLPEIDTDESNNTGENYGAVLGIYTHTDMENIDVAMTGTHPNGSTYEDDLGTVPHEFSYDLGQGTVTSGLDYAGRYYASITDQNGNTHSVTLSVYQTQNGDVFIRLPDGYQVTSVSIESVQSDSFSAITTDASSTSTVVCYLFGTLIETSFGAVRVEHLATGDFVRTLDRGFQPITWIEAWRTNASDRTAPVLIPAHSLGRGQPERDLLVSRQHRLLLASDFAQELFGERDVLIPAHRLIGLNGIDQPQREGPLHYAHFKCPRHEIIWANGLLSETLYMGPWARQFVKRWGSKPVPRSRREADAPPARTLHPGKSLNNLVSLHMRTNTPFSAACHEPA
jgi:hypothetical protein